MQPVSEQLSTLLTRARWDDAIALLERHNADEAAELVMDLEFEQQEELFRKLPPELAARLVGAVPYYHAYVLLHSRPLDEMNAIVDRMNPGERMHFFDELPEETWQTLMDELALAQSSPVARRPDGVSAAAAAAVPAVIEPAR